MMRGCLFREADALLKFALFADVVGVHRAVIAHYASPNLTWLALFVAQRRFLFVAHAALLLVVGRKLTPLDFAFVSRAAVILLPKEKKVDDRSRPIARAV